MLSNDLENDIEHEIPQKRMKYEDKKDFKDAALVLSKILQREIETEIKLRKTDLDTIEENIFLTKKSLLRLRQGVVSDFYRERNQKEFLQHPPHAAVKDTFIGKSPRDYVFSDSSKDSTDFNLRSNEPEIKPISDTIKYTEGDGGNSEVPENLISKPPCYVPPKPLKVETVKPPEPRGYISKKHLKIVVGNVSKWLAPSEVGGATHKWTVYTKSADPSVDLSTYLSKVVFFLHPSYKPNDVVPVTYPPFKLTRRGWGEFPLKARFHFKNPLDTPVDLMHVLKLDHKHTGLETFGSETTLSVWIHSPDKGETLNDLEGCEVTLKKEKRCDDVTEVENKEILNVNEDRINQGDVVEIEDENKTTLEAFNNIQIEPDIKSEDIFYFDEEIVWDSEFNNDDLPFFKSEEDIAKMKSAIELIKKDMGVLEDNEITKHDEAELAHNNVPVNIFKNNLKCEVKEEVEPEPTGNQEFNDDFFDECNVVESEVVIDCDDDDSSLNNSKPDDEVLIGSEPDMAKCNTGTDASKSDFDTLISEPSDVHSEQRTAPKDMPCLNDSNDQLMYSVVPDISATRLVNNEQDNELVGISQTILNHLEVPLLEIDKPQATLAGSINIQNISEGKKSENRTLNVNSLTSLCNNMTFVPLVKSTTPVMSGEVPVISVNNVQSNNPQIIQNNLIKTGSPNLLKGKVISLVKTNPNRPVNVMYSKTLPGKVLLKKLNGEISQILTPVKQEPVPSTSKSAEPIVFLNQGKIVHIPQGQAEGISIPITNLRKLTNDSKTGITLNKGKTFNISLPAASSNVHTNKGTLPVLNTIESDHMKRRRTNNLKDVKSTIIMFQKENGQVLLRKEARFRDCRDDLNSSSSTKKNSISTESKNLNEKKDAQEVMTTVTKIMANQNNASPSFIKLQIPGNLSHENSSIGPGGKQFVVLNPNVIKITNNSPSKKVVPAVSVLKKTEESKPPSSRNDPFSESILLKDCPTQNTEIAVSWLIKRFPLVDSRAQMPGFRTKHPYCAKSTNDFLNWPFPKQRAAEWMRAKAIVKLLNKLPSLTTKWSTIEVWDWARIRAFTPMKMDPAYEGPTIQPDIKYFYTQPTEEIIDLIKRCKDKKEKEMIDVISDVPDCDSRSARTSSIEKKDFKFHLPPNKKETPFEPELEGMRTFINKCQNNVGAMSCPEELSPGIFYPAAERALISVFNSIAEDIIRRSYNASWIRHCENAPPEINVDDVKCAILSRKEFDFLVPCKVEKKERPPVTLLPNFS